jgi:hypothetical protein
VAAPRTSSARRILPYIIGFTMGTAYGIWAAPTGALAIALAFAFLGGLSLVLDLAVKNAIALGNRPSPDQRTARGARAATELKGFAVAARVALSVAVASGLLGATRLL